MNKTIEILVMPTGETRLQTKGFAGASCQLASQALEQALGTRQAEQRTAEFYASSLERDRLQERQC